jgi:hypothetical protein
MQQLVKDNPQRPNIALGRIIFFVKDLRSHVDGTPHTCLIGHRGIFDDLAEPEVADLEVTSVDEDVGRF